jgi:hypothetical protein
MYACYRLVLAIDLPPTWGHTEMELCISCLRCLLAAYWVTVERKEHLFRSYQTVLAELETSRIKPDYLPCPSLLNETNSRTTLLVAFNFSNGLLAQKWIWKIL